jgi:hypothetical protein
MANNCGFWFGWLDLLAPLVQVLLMTLKYSAIAGLHIFQFAVAHALWFPVFTGRLLATDLDTEISTSNVFEVFLLIRLQSLWNLGTTKFFWTHSFSLRLTHNCPWTKIVSQVKSYVTTEGQSASVSWNKAHIWGLRPDFYYCQTAVGLLMWVALSNERTDLWFTIAAGPRHRSHFTVSFRDFPFRRLLRLKGLQWRYSTPPPHGNHVKLLLHSLLLLQALYTLHSAPVFHCSLSYNRYSLHKLHTDHIENVFHSWLLLL